MAEADQAAFDAMLKYVRHVSVYRAMRAAGYYDCDPIAHRTRNKNGLTLRCTNGSANFSAVELIVFE